MSTTRGFKRILLATDGSEQSEAALRMAIDLAMASTARVLVTQVWNLELHHRHGYWDLQVRSEARRLVDDAVGRLQAAGVLADSEIIRADTDHVAQAIAAAAKVFDADLLVVGSRDLSDWQTILHHTVSHQALCGVDCPMLIVRNRPEAPDPESHRVLLAIAGGSAIEPAARSAIAAAAATGAMVHIVHVAQTIIGPQGQVYVESDEEIAATVSAAVQMVDEAGIVVAATGAPRASAAHTVGDMAEAWNADVIVIGSSRLSDIGSLVLGSVSHHLLRTTGRPVLISLRSQA
jgi:nucleotide-binding universal stress UspA family protein